MHATASPGRTASAAKPGFVTGQLTLKHGGSQPVVHLRFYFFLATEKGGAESTG